MSHSHADYAARKHPEFVALDIGGDTGALILHTDPELHGAEIELSPSGADATRTHKQVLERSVGGRPAFTAVFDDLAEGDYALWRDEASPVRGVRVRGGEVVQLDWRTR